MSAERFRLVILGSGKVGKTSVIQRYLYNNFSEKYKETVEDMYSREFRIHGSLLPLDILDTNFYYPDMKKLSIASANAFLLVFSVENVVSFKDVTEAMDELCRLRSDVEKLPVVVAGNKCDLPGKKIFPETAYAWISRLPFKSDIRYFEVSAKTGEKIVDIFRALLEISGFPFNMKQQSVDPSLLVPATPPKRTRSFRGSSAKRNREVNASPDAGSEKSSPASRLSRTFSKKEKEKEKRETLTRHDSLIRRTQRLSLKIKHAPQDEPDESDCIIS